jgi:hypothetical protein
VTWTYDDGGRADAGYVGDAGDCVTRAIAIATGIDYATVYDALAAGMASSRGRHHTRGKRSARNGVFRNVYDPYLAGLGWRWTPTMAVGQGCRVHLRADELPAGRIVARLSRHVCAVIDGVIHDTADPSRDGTRCVYGYWTAP